MRLDATTGSPIRTLVPSGVVGDEVAVSPDGGSVFFEVAKGCDHQVWKVAMDGRDPTAVAPSGSLPAINPAGNLLAYAQQPRDLTPGCFPGGPDNGADQWKLVIDDLSTHVVRDLPMAPATVASGLPFSISHLSWSEEGNVIAVSIAAPEDNEGWALNLVNPTTDEYYFGDSIPSVPAPGGSASQQLFWREGVFQPDGNLFVVSQCCAGLPERTTSVEMEQVRPASGAVVHTIATGLTTVAHTSLSVDRSGRWFLYLSGANLEVSRDGAKPRQLASGFVAAAW